MPVVQCPSCRQPLQAPEHLVGYEVQCPGCQKVFVARAAGPHAITTTPDVPLPGGRGRDEAPEGNRQPRSRAYAADDEDDEDDEGPSIRRQYTSLPGGGTGVATVSLIVLDVLFCLALIGLNVVNFSRVDLRGPFDEPDAIDALTLGVAVLYLVLSIALTVVFCVWVWQAYKNLQILGVRRLQHSPGWAVGYWFIPILNLWQPYVVFQEMWKASDPDASEKDWRRQNGSYFLGFWWALHLVAVLIGSIAFRASFNMDAPPAEQKVLLVVDSVANALWVLSSLCLIGVVRGLRARQVEKFEAAGGVPDGEDV